MKKTFLFLAAMALVLAVAPISSATATPAASYSITFDGYCDGLHFNIPSVGLGDPTTADGDQTGCVSGGIFGEFSASAKSIYFTIPGFSTFTVIKLDHTWVHYGLSGNLIYIVNSGTWSPGSPDGRTGVPSSTPRAAVATAAPRSKTIDVLFDGYCDGMEFHVPSIGLGTPHTVDGNRTGCASEGLMGATTKINGYGTIVVTFNVGFWIQTAVFLDPNHDWIHYSISGDTIYILNSGTWSPGSPVGSGRSSTR